jgi:serine/threonine protein kinase
MTNPQPQRDDLPHTVDYVSTRASRASAGPLTAGGAPAAAAIPGYDLVRVLGRGGMGIVYQAFDRKRQQMVALKTLHGADPAALYRLKQEFRSLADVAHRNLVNYYELAAGEGHWLLAMELVEGVNFLEYVRGTQAATGLEPTFDAGSTVELAAAAMPGSDASGVAQHGPIQPAAGDYDRLRDAMRQLAAGVAAIHQMGKLHRDLKPSNVLVAGDGRVVILDFGLAAELDGAGRHESDESIVGTFAYMAPEQAASQPVSPASDWYSVGVMLYEALTGKMPFSGTVVQVLASKQSREPPPPSALAPQVPRDLDELCAALLRRSPAARPEGSEVLRRLQAAAETAPAPLPASAAAAALLVGRERHLQALHSAYVASRQGRLVAILPHGRSGMGKSLLVQHFLQSLAAQGAVVLAGKCYERESVPYKALDSLVDAMSALLMQRDLNIDEVLPREFHLLTRLFPVLQRVAPGAAERADSIVDPQESRRRAFAALRELLARLAQRRPLVLFIDDLQWGDTESAAALTELLRPPDPPAVLLVGSYRSEDLESSPCLGPLLKSWEQIIPPGDLRPLAVEPLAEEDSRELALALLGARDAAAQTKAETVARESGGNPFFVQVLVQGLRSSADPAQRPAAAGNLTIDQVLWERIQTLPDHARRLLEVIAVSGQPLLQADACQAAELGAGNPAALSWLRSGRLIRSGGAAERETVETYHDRVRETILARLPEGAIQVHHGRLALAIENSAPQAGSTHADKRLFDLAYHFDAAGDAPRALPYALAAAQQARSRHALQIAEQQFRIAERGAAAQDEATKLRVAEGLGEVLMLRGQYEPAVHQLQSARSLAPDALGQSRIEGKLGEVAFKQGDLPTAAAAIERALRLLGKHVPRSRWGFRVFVIREALAQFLHTCCPRWFVARKSLADADTELAAIRLYSRLGYPYWFCRGAIPCFWTHLRELNLAERYPPTPELAQAYSAHAPAMSMVGWFSRAFEYSEKSLVIRRSLGDRWGEGQSLHFYGVALYAAARCADCIEKSRTACELLEQTGDHWELNSARYQVALSLYRLGDLRGAVQEAWRFHEAALELGDVQGAAMSLDVWAMASRGRVPAEIISAEMARPSEDAQRAAQVMLSDAVRLLAGDRVAEAADLLTRAVRRVRQAGLSSAYIAPVFAWHATACRKLAEAAAEGSGERKLALGRAGVAAQQAWRVARRFQNDLPHALRERAILAALGGRPGPARQLFQKSLDCAERLAARYERAQTLEARGRIGQQLGWPGAAADTAAAQQAYAALDIA